VNCPKEIAESLSRLDLCQTCLTLPTIFLMMFIPFPIKTSLTQIRIVRIIFVPELPG
jgi:hypothetical protein